MDKERPSYFKKYPEREQLNLFRSYDPVEERTKSSLFEKENQLPDATRTRRELEREMRYYMTDRREEETPSSSHSSQRMFRPRVVPSVYKHTPYISPRQRKQQLTSLFDQLEERLKKEPSDYLLFAPDDDDDESEKTVTESEPSLSKTDEREHSLTTRSIDRIGEQSHRALSKSLAGIIKEEGASYRKHSHKNSALFPKK